MLDTVKTPKSQVLCYDEPIFPSIIESVKEKDNAKADIPPPKPHSEPKVEAKPEETIKPKDDYQVQIVWRNVIQFALLHIGALYGWYLMFASAKILTTIWAILLYQASLIGITGGAHRLWSHRAYKAKWQLKLILITFNTLAFQNHVYDWVRDHRVHHKYSETDADPHNAKRGFFFSHVGWLMCRKHPDVIEKGKAIDLQDLHDDPFVMFQRRHTAILVTLVCFILPTMVPVYFWGETWHNSWYVATIWRYAFNLNVTWLVNSAAHMWGLKPYDKSISPAENLSVSILTLGEGWHNYHHVFPWDYKTDELGNYRANFTTGFIDIFAKIGWAYDLKTVPKSLVRKRAERTGDGTWKDWHEEGIWGWGDKDMPKEEADDAIILQKDK